MPALRVQIPQVEEGQLKLVNEEMQRLKIAPFPRTFGMEEILLFTLDGWKTKIRQSTEQEDPDVAQYMSRLDWLRTSLNSPADLLS